MTGHPGEDVPATERGLCDRIGCGPAHGGDCPPHEGHSVWPMSERDIAFAPVRAELRAVAAEIRGHLDGLVKTRRRRDALVRLLSAAGFSERAIAAEAGVSGPRIHQMTSRGPQGAFDEIGGRPPRRCPECDNEPCLCCDVDGSA